MNRFFVPPRDIEGENLYIKDVDDIRHIVKSLRLTSGEKLEISDGSKWQYIVEIGNISKDEIECKILDRQAFCNEPVVSISIYQGIPKHSKMDMIVEKSVELGISEIIPFQSIRTDVKNRDGLKNKLLRWNKIALSAAKQARREIIPVVKAPISFKEVLSEISSYDQVIFCYEDEEKKTLKDLLRDMGESKGKRICVIIGSEGGFSEEEIQQIRGIGVKPVSIGKRTLRTETAGLATVSMILYELEL